MRLLIPFLFAAALAPAQIVSFGMKAGAPVTDATPDYFQFTGTSVDTGRWTIGPTFEVRLLAGFSFEIDALYRGYRQQRFSTLILGTGFVTLKLGTGGYTLSPFRSDTKAWDFPLLLKYRIPSGLLGRFPGRPFVDAGASFTHESFDTEFSYATGSNLLNQPLHFEASHHRWGAVGGAGVEFKYGKVKIAPEVRYTRLTNPGTNQVTILAGFTF